jgi:two pore calcium channel protein, plant
MVLFILGYVLFFGWMGNHIFEGNLEGTRDFNTLGESIWNMWILITSANFPDVMLSAYSRIPISFFYFFTYLLFGLFLAMNLLLAIFYTTYLETVAKEIIDLTKQRDEYFNDMWERYAEVDENGELTLNK